MRALYDVRIKGGTVIEGHDWIEAANKAEAYLLARRAHPGKRVEVVGILAALPEQSAQLCLFSADAD